MNDWGYAKNLDDLFQMISMDIDEEQLKLWKEDKYDGRIEYHIIEVTPTTITVSDWGEDVENFTKIYYSYDLNEKMYYYFREC